VDVPAEVVAEEAGPVPGEECHRPVAEHVRRAVAALGRAEAEAKPPLLAVEVVPAALQPAPALVALAADRRQLAAVVRAVLKPEPVRVVDRARLALVADRLQPVRAARGLVKEHLLVSALGQAREAEPIAARATSRPAPVQRLAR